jgi:hypothetical protein
MVVNHKHRNGKQIYTRGWSEDIIKMQIIPCNT